MLAIDVDGEAPEPRLIHGVVSRFAHGDAGRRLSVYVVTLVPATSRMRLRTDSRIFQKLTVPEILADVFERAGFGRVDRRADRPGGPRRAPSGYETRLAGAYLPRENCVQYRESDWDFANRLMEEEGIHYFFEHDASSHVLAISDRPVEHLPIAAGSPSGGGDAIPYRPAGGALAPGEHVYRFQIAEELRPSRVVVSDYDFERPMLNLTHAAPADGGAARGDAYPFEVFEHPGDHDTPEAGSSLARIRLEEQQASRWTGDGDTDSARLSPGRTFALTEHPSAELNRGYLVTRVEHRWAEGDASLTRYACRFEVMPSDVAFRPPRRTPRPIIHGIQTAIVVGPPGEEIFTDEHGRIKVRFHWDRSGRDDDRCSCWMRVAQASAGGAWGSLFLPRVGHEVVVDFLEGDPDRPLVTGSVYHGANVPPYALPAERTKTTIKTSSSPGGGGSNELRFEDKAGGEEVYLHAEKDMSVKVENDKDQKVGSDETLKVSGNRTVTVDECHTETVLLAPTILVGGALTETVGAADGAHRRRGEDRDGGRGQHRGRGAEEVDQRRALVLREGRRLRLGEVRPRHVDPGRREPVGRGREGRDPDGRARSVGVRRRRRDLARGGQGHERRGDGRLRRAGLQGEDLDRRRAALHPVRGERDHRREVREDHDRGSRHHGEGDGRDPGRREEAPGEEQPGRDGGGAGAGHRQGNEG